MRAVVAHPLWGRIGGIELVNAFFIKTLLEAGHDVVAVSTFDFNRKKYKESFDIDLEGIKIYYLLPRILPLFGIYQSLCFYMPLSKAIKKEKPDLVFVDSELYKPIIKLKKKGLKLIEYIHFPFHALRLEQSDVPKEYKEVFERYLVDSKRHYGKYEGRLWKQYFRFWLKLYGRVARDNPFEAADVVMANSRYTARFIKMLWQSEPLVLNPPVKVRDFESQSKKSYEERDNTILMIGRIAPEKRAQDVIDAISLTDTKPTLRLVGELISTTLPYKEYLEKRAKEKGVQIEYHLNVHRKELANIATSSRIFVHATIGEHFGIAVVEGMAAGCPVVVHRSGGPFEEIVHYGEYGLSYDSLEELAESIDRMMTEPRLWEHYHQRSLERAPAFSEKEFARKLLKVVQDSR